MGVGPTTELHARDLRFINDTLASSANWIPGCCVVVWPRRGVWRGCLVTGRRSWTRHGGCKVVGRARGARRSRVRRGGAPRGGNSPWRPA